MKKLTIFFFFLLSSLFSLAQFPPTDPAYKIAFQDEFDSIYKTSPLIILDSSKWDRSPRWNQPSNFTGNLGGPGNCFSSVSDTVWDIASLIKDIWDSTTIRVSNGTCKLVTDKISYPGEVWNWLPCDADSSFCDGYCYYHGSDTVRKCFVRDTLPFLYRTGMLHSKHTFRYGYFEMRFKIPEGDSTTKGMGPDFWLFAGDTSTNARYSEIDIFEMDSYKPAGANHSNYYTCNAHYKGSASWDTVGLDLHNHPFGYRNLPADTGWRKAGMWWTPEFIKYFYNDVLIFDSPCRIDTVYPDSLTGMNIWVEINSPATNFCNNFDTVNTQYPYVFEIDYIRVYQLNMKCDTDTVYCNSNATTFESGLYKSLGIGGSGCVDTFSAGANITGLGVDYVLLDEGFMIDATSTAYFNVLDCPAGQYPGMWLLPETPLTPPKQWSILHHSQQ